MEGWTRSFYLFARFAARWNLSAFARWRGKDSEGRVHTAGKPCDPGARPRARPLSLGRRCPLATDGSTSSREAVHATRPHPGLRFAAPSEHEAPKWDVCAPCFGQWPWVVVWVVAEGPFHSQPASPASLPATAAPKSGVNRDVEMTSMDPGVCPPQRRLAVPGARGEMLLFTHRGV